MNNPELNSRIRLCRDCQLGELRAARGALAVPAYAGKLYTTGGLAALSERPAIHEEAAGLPFVGPSGEVLDQILNDAGVARESLLILNRLACGIPRGENLQDYPDALGNCDKWVQESLDYYNPRVVLLMGGPAIQMVFGARARVSDFRHVSRTVGGRTYIGSYHPVNILRRDADPSLYQWCVEDWQLARERLRESMSLTTDS